MPARLKFDILAAIRQLDEDPLSPAWRTSYERAESDRVAERYGIAPQPGRIYIDLEQRDMTAAGVSGSNYFVGVTSRDAFLPSLQGASIARRLGAQVMPIEKDQLAMPVVTTPPTTAWLADENTAISTTQAVIGSKSATPKTVAALVTFSHQLARQSSPSVERLLFSELGRAAGAALDGAVFNGSGSSGEPLGILGESGVQSASGATIAWASICDMIEDAGTVGAAMLSPGFAATPAVVEVLMQREVSASSGVMFTMDANRLAGFPLAAAKNGPSASLVFADFADVYIPMWGVLEILVDPFTGFRKGLISMRAMLRADVLVAHSSAIAVRTSVS